MTGPPDPWSSLHARLHGIVPYGATYPRRRRAAKNAYWYLAGPAGVEPAGWGDLAGDDLERVADLLAVDELFLPVREHPATLVGPDLARDVPPAEPTADLLVDGVTWIVAAEEVRIVVVARPDQLTYGAPPPGGNLPARLLARDELRVLLRPATTAAEVRQINSAFDADLADAVASGSHASQLWEALRRVSADPDSHRRVLAVAAGEAQFSELTAEERSVAHAIIGARLARLARRAAMERFDDPGSD